MLKVRSVLVPCAYSTIGREPVQLAPAPIGTMSAADAVVGSSAPPTVSYSMWYIRMSHTGGPLSDSTCWFAAAAFSSASSAEVVTVDNSCGGVCNSAPRCGGPPFEPGCIPLPPPPQPASSSARCQFPSRRMVFRIF